MDIHGLQKLTLLDYPGRVACTVFIAGCNFACPYCHNSGLIKGNMPAAMQSEELLDFLKKRRGVLEGVCITGGEPLLNPKLPELIGEIKALGYPVKLDTNGSLPLRLKSLLDGGLVDYVAMDIKNSPSKYAFTSGIPKALSDSIINSIKESISLITGSAPDYEFRTTVVSGFFEERDFIEIGQLIKGAKAYYLQAFADRDTVLCSDLKSPSRAELEGYGEIIRPFVRHFDIRGI